MCVGLCFAEVMVEWTGTFTQLPFQEIKRDPYGHFTTSADNPTNATDAFCKLLNKFNGKLWCHKQKCTKVPAGEQHKCHYHYTVQNWIDEDDKNSFEQLFEQMTGSGTQVIHKRVYSPIGLQAWLEIHTGLLYKVFDYVIIVDSLVGPTVGGLKLFYAPTDELLQMKEDYKLCPSSVRKDKACSLTLYTHFPCK